MGNLTHFYSTKSEFSTNHMTGQPSAPTDLSAKGYPHHIELSGSAEDDERTAYILIKQAQEDELYTPIGIQRPEVRRFTDYLGEPGLYARYRICAVGYSYQESVFAFVGAETHPFSDDELLDMVQRAHIRPYAERAHPEAGLALEECLPATTIW